MSYNPYRLRNYGEDIQITVIDNDIIIVIIMRVPIILHTVINMTEMGVIPGVKGVITIQVRVETLHRQVHQHIRRIRRHVLTQTRLVQVQQRFQWGPNH